MTPKITIYTTPNCGYCYQAKEYFKKKGLGYEEHDVIRDLKKREEMVRSSGQISVPVIEINGKIVVGFNLAKINQLLNLN